MSDVEITQWDGCYPSSWKGIIVPEAFQHPAKFSSKLIERIYRHAVDEMHWLAPGDRVIDPFGGVALGAYPALRYGLDWTGCELESRFVNLGNQNIDLWNATYQNKLAKWGTARLIQGDSRNLSKVISQADAAISSPPFIQTQGGCNVTSTTGPLSDPRLIKRHSAGNQSANGYGTSDGQLSNLQPGDYKAAISSPPFEDCLTVVGQKNRDRGPAFNRVGRGCDIDYGNTTGQIGQDHGETFWTAARTIIEQTYQVLTPGGHAIWVTKRYVKNKSIVDFTGQWIAVCESVGFRTLHIHHAMLVRHNGTSLTLDGGKIEHKTESKSFFRRLAESKGSPRIDWEDVVCMVKA